jgi:hypothetical protein
MALPDLILPLFKKRNRVFSRVFRIKIVWWGLIKLLLAAEPHAGLS